MSNHENEKFHELVREQKEELDYQEKLMDNDTLSTHMITLGNIRVAIVKADNCMDGAKSQVQGAFTGLIHHSRNDMNTLGITVECLRFALQELEFIPYKQLKLDIRCLLAALEKKR